VVDTGMPLTYRDIKNCTFEFSDVTRELSRSPKYTFETKYGTVWYRSLFYAIRNREYIVHICSDITERRTTYERLSKEALFFQETKEGVVITDENGNIQSVNASFCEITGYTMNESIGENCRFLSSGVHSEDFYRNMWESLSHFGFWQGEIWNKRKNGEVYPQRLSITRSCDPDSGEINFLGLFSDISAIKETDKKLQFYANHDPLTGLYNRTQFEEILGFTISSAARRNTKFALISLDIDHFKEVNDTYGHHIGDKLLKIVASKFHALLREDDIIARIGGDEFNIILDGIDDEADAIVISQRLLESVKQPIVIDGNTCFITLSIGIAFYPIHGDNAIELIKNADSAMYEVKKNNRDSFIVYHQEFTQELMKKVSLLYDLKNTLENDGLTIHFQPFYDASSETICGAEVLVRWFHPQKGFISPEEFIPIAEQHGMIMQLGRKIVRDAFEKLPGILAHTDTDFKLAINISAREFFDEDFPGDLLKMMDAYSVRAENIELEITETYAMQNHEEAIIKLTKLKAHNISLAIDDFGTGYSSLSYLKMFPIDKLKIDKSFIRNFTEDTSDRLIVSSIINIARIFNLKVQAEGVETLEHANLLKEMSCDIFQGYYYSRPMDFEALIELLSARRMQTPLT